MSSAFTSALRDPGEGLLLATVLEGPAQGESILLRGETPVWPEPLPPFWAEHRKALSGVTASGTLKIAEQRVFAERFGASPQLVVCGGGHVGAAVVRLAKVVGLPVCGLEDRPEYAAELEQAGAESVICAPFEEGLRRIPGGQENYFVVVTRAHSWDVACLQAILRKPAAYVGMMGSHGRSALVREQLEKLDAPLLSKLSAAVDPLDDCASMIENTIVDDPPLTIREGGMIRKGANEEADRLRDIMEGGSGTIAAIEASEREKTGIRTLKVGFNRVFGYYIEVSKSFIDQVPAEYIRKQTLANCERYITQDLKELENQVLTAKDRLTALEYQIFTQLRENLAAQAARVQGSAAAVAAADALCSLASVAVQRGYCRPEISLGREISITDGRHPVVEAMQKDALFVPNDTNLGGDNNQVAIITGPNMAGKSTYMRQVALIVLMAQMGSFVPARSARIGLVDRVFTRIGASDDLASGQSTFMVEMAEVASILKYATAKSLLILDEIGRGTSTYDGMAIARAVLEYTANPKRLGAKTLFATHYHELSALENQLANVKNYNIAVKKRGDQMIFLRKIVPGATDDSYGIEVAKLAGLPAPVIARAREILSELEAEGAPAPAVRSREPEDQISMLDLTGQQAIQALRAIQVETLTPIEAMNELYKLRKMLD